MTAVAANPSMSTSAREALACGRVLGVLALMAFIAFPIGVLKHMDLAWGSGPESGAFCTEHTVRAVAEDVERYRVTTGRYPTTAEGLRVVVPAANDDDEWKLRDCFGNWLQYASPGVHNPETFDVWSAGIDGVLGTDDDIWSDE